MDGISKPNNTHSCHFFQYIRLRPQWARQRYPFIVHPFRYSSLSQTHAHINLTVFSSIGLLLLDEPATRPAPAQVWLAEGSPVPSEDLGLRLRTGNSIRSFDDA